jgi:hypothetical protein
LSETAGQYVEIDGTMVALADVDFDALFLQSLRERFGFAPLPAKYAVEKAGRFVSYMATVPLVVGGSRGERALEPGDLLSVDEALIGRGIDRLRKTGDVVEIPAETGIVGLATEALDRLETLEVLILRVLNPEGGLQAVFPNYPHGPANAPLPNDS